MRTLESLAVSRRAAGRLTGLPFSLSVHAAAAGLVLLFPLLAPPELPATPDRPTVCSFGVPPAPPVQPTPPAPPRPVARGTGAPAGPRRGGPVTRVSTAIPDGLPTGDPGPSSGVMVLNGCDGCGGDDPGLPPGLGLPAADTTPPALVLAGRDVTPPRKLRHVAPAYPELAQRAGVAAVVVVECTIDPWGRIADARVLRGHPLFDAAALEAVRQWVYTPTLVGGVPVSVLMTVTVDFHLKR